MQVTGHNSSWVSPFGHPRINARLPTPQGISQAPTSFIGSRCQGIHHVPLTTCPQQTTNTHKHHTQQHPCTHVSSPSRNKPRLREHTKQSTKQHDTPHTHTPRQTHQRAIQKHAPARCQCSRPLSKNQTTRDSTSTHPPITGKRRLMPQTPNSVPCNQRHVVFH